jgi:hypothetical protein
MKPRWLVKRNYQKLKQEVGGSGVAISVPRPELYWDNAPAPERLCAAPTHVRTRRKTWDSVALDPLEHIPPNRQG